MDSIHVCVHVYAQLYVHVHVGALSPLASEITESSTCTMWLKSWWEMPYSTDITHYVISLFSVII